MTAHYSVGNDYYDCSRSRPTTPGPRRAARCKPAPLTRLSPASCSAISGEEVALALAATDEVTARRAGRPGPPNWPWSELATKPNGLNGPALGRA